MTGEDQTRHDRECGGDVAAYALGALDPLEMDSFRAHLDGCIVCRDELASFQQVVDLLPTSAPQHAAPRGLRRRVLKAVREEHGASPAPSPRWARGGLRTLTRRPAIALGVAVLALLGVLGGVELASSGSGVAVYRASVFGSPGTAELRVSGGHGELVVNHLPPPPPGRIYEVWVQHPHRAPQPTSALFSVTADGAADVGVPGDLHGVARVMVTRERSGGSKVPTLPVVILAPLA